MQRSATVGKFCTDTLPMVGVMFAAISKKNDINGGSLSGNSGSLKENRK